MAKRKTKTTKFRKLVLSPGSYPQGDDSVEFDKERLEKIAANGNQFLETGARIPVPFAHTDEKGKLISPVNVGSRGALRDAFSGQPIGWRSDMNSGFVESFEYGEVEDEEGNKYEGLIATMEIDGTDDDENSPAFKFGRTIREVSLGLKKDKTDNAGNSYDELPIHVAACINPVDDVQPNFELLETFSDNTLLFNTSFPEDGEKDANSENDESQEKPKNPALPDDSQASSGADQAVANVVEGLRQCGFDLPEDTNAENFFERMTIAIRQRVATENSAKNEDDDSLTAEPKGSQPSGAPIAMSDNAIDTLKKQTELLFSEHLKVRRNKVKDRVSKLVKCGRISAKYAESKLVPMVEETITLSAVTLDDMDLETGSIGTTEVESLLDALEESAGEDLTKAATTSEEPQGEEFTAPNDEDNTYWSFHTAEDHQQTFEEAHALATEFPV